MKNIRPLDRFLRLVFGVLFTLLGYFWLGSPWSWLAYIAAIILFATAAFRFCPIYKLFGIAPSAANDRPAGALSLGLAALFLAALVGGAPMEAPFSPASSFLKTSTP
jgi:Protein of unknown function (DUF2892)